MPGTTEEPFIILAMLSLVMSTMWAARHHELFLNFYYSTEMLGLTHLVTLGFITSIIMGILHRLVPMALSVEECRQINAAVERAGIKLQLGFMRRFDEGFQQAKELVDSGEMGRVMIIKSTGRGPGGSFMLLS